MKRTSPAATGLVAELFARTRRRKVNSILAWSAAIAAHGFVATFAIANVRDRTELAPPVEVEFVPKEEPPPLPPPPEPEVDEPEAKAETPPVRAPAAPQAARAAALVTAKPEAPAAQDPDEPVDFTSDPTATNYGGGVVALGGSADFGHKGAKATGKLSAPAPVTSARTSGDSLTPVSDLSRKPELRDADPCRGFFPSTAEDDSANVAVLLVIGKTGQVSSVKLVSESPPAQGFGAAARACMLSQKFTPALDRSGNAARTQIRVNVRFRR